MKKRYAMLLLLGCVLVQTGLSATGSGTLRHAGRDRTYLIHVPQSYDAVNPTSLVIGLHGAGNTAETHEYLSQLSPIADREGFIVVYPNATPLQRRQIWNSNSVSSRADDVDFISTLIDTLSGEYTIDPNRVFVFGNSNGAFMAHHLGARLPYKIAAIATCAGVLSTNDFYDGPPVGVVLFHGDADPLVPYETYPEYGYLGAEGSAALWAQRNGCDPEPEVIRDDTLTLARKWNAPDGYGDVILYKAHGLGHTIPVDPHFHAGEIAWAFFTDHPKMADYVNEDGPIQNLRTGQRYNYIKSAIHDADNGDEIVLAPATYEESINLTGKNIVLRSQEPNNPTITAQTVIQGDGGIPVVRFSDNNVTCVLRGLTITGGSIGCLLQRSSPGFEYCQIMENAGHGIEMQAKSDPQISHSLICTNDGAGIHMTGFVDVDFALYNEPELINCTIAQNTEGGIQGGIVTLRNCIVYGNETGQLSSASATVTYSCIEGGYTGMGNIGADPHFARLAYLDPNGTPDDPNDNFQVPGDYHLKSQAGRYDPNSTDWVLDDVTSPCIDTGDPNTPVSDEPSPNGDRINMGVYGGTCEASKSYINESN